MPWNHKMYTFPAKTSPFPRFEPWLIVFGWTSIILGNTCHIETAIFFGAICIWCWLPIFIIRWIMEKRKISDFAFSVLRDQSEFPAIQDAWEKVCGKQNRPTWKQLQKICSLTYKNINHK
ncbi:hypothetical protein ACSSZE_03105 [Acidithiobacillus caldus]